MLQTVCIKLSDEGFYSVWTWPGAASHIGNNHFIHIWKLFSLPVSTSKPDGFNPQAIRYMFKQRSFSFSFFFSRHGNKFCCVYYGWPRYFNIFLVAWRKKGFPFNTILIYCDKIQQDHIVHGEKRKNHKLKPNRIECRVNKSHVTLFQGAHKKCAHTDSAIRSQGTLPDSALQAKEHFLFTSLKQTLIPGHRSIRQRWERCWPTPRRTWLVLFPCCEHLFSAAEARRQLAALAQLLDQLTFSNLTK